jgi:hypothetical protein
MEHHRQIRPGDADQLLTALADRTSREVLAYLTASPTETATVEELVDVVTDRDDGSSCEERAEVVLHHSTLPKLAATDVLDYDADDRTVRYRGDPALEAMLAALDDEIS